MQEEVLPCKTYRISVYLHHIQGFIEDGRGNGWQDYHPNIEDQIISNLNAVYNKYGFFFQLVGSRDWFTRVFTDPARSNITLLGIFEDPQSLQHEDAIDIYLLPANSEVSGGYVPGNNKKVMLLGGTRTVEHCSGETKTYQVASTQVVSHEMGHCLGLPHTFEQRIGTTIDLVRENACVGLKDCLDCPVVDIFPNPAATKIYVNHRTETNNGEEFESYQEYTIIDLNGRSVFHTSSTRKNLILEVSDLNSGLFVLIIKNQHSDVMRYKLAIAR